MKKALFIALLAVASLAHGQAANPSIVLVSTAPSGSCGNGLPDQQVLSTGLIYSCQAGTWAQIGTGGSVGSAVTFNNSGTGAASGSTFNGSAPVTVSYNTLGLTGPASVSAVGGDIACAQAADSTIAAKTITGGSSTASAITITGAAGFNNSYWVGEVIQVQGASPSGYNQTNQRITALTSTTGITFANVANPGAWSSGGTVSKYCGNQTNDAIAATAYTFLNTFAIPANWMAVGFHADVEATLLYYTSSTAANIGQFRLLYGGTTVYQNQTAFTATTNALSTAIGGSISWTIHGLGTTAAFFEPLGFIVPSTVTGNLYSNSNNVVQPATALSTSAGSMTASVYFAATGCCTGLTYVSGGTISGTQTCTLATFNNGCTGTTANIVITSGTPGAITITARGAACTSAPTTATIAGTNCTGTVTMSGGVLVGATGTALEMGSLAVKQ